MKKYIKLIILALLFINTSCDEWLDIKPEDKVTEDDLYADSYGYRAILNGLYLSMSDASLYGRELSFAFVDVLSKQYDLDASNLQADAYRRLNDFEYDNAFVVPIIEDIWLNAYNIISNANNLIESVENKTDDFFAMGEIEKKMIHGEALACRALMHFDLLRIFAPSLINNDNANYIPYVDTYGELSPNGIGVEECLNNVIDDLVKAQELTMGFDTTDLGIAASCTKGARFLSDYHSKSVLGKDEDKKVNIFYKNRGYRLNYYAITALLARVYQYAGKHEDALDCAEQVMDIRWKYGNFYDFNTYGIKHSTDLVGWDATLEAWDNKDNLRLLDNLIFACYNPELDEPAYGVLCHFYKELDGSKYFVLNTENQKVFENSSNTDESKDDVRSQYMIFGAGNGMYNISGKWYYSSDNEKRHNSFNIIPMIRLTEMYYIAAESYARSGDFAKAKSLLEDVRDERGCDNDITVNNWDEFQTELVIDARREWISEGQLFYLYKRLNAPVDFANGQEPRPLNAAECVVPIPDNQSL